jgi:cyclophilin family peptidyl-prolyl cis-trans isomerase
MKKLIGIMLIGAALIAGCKGKKSTEMTQAQKDSAALAAQKAAQPDTLAFDPATLPEEPEFDIVTTMGTIRIKLYKDTPLHRANFEKLASQRYYDNILFHRVINGFMIQTGDPATKDPNSDASTWGQGGPGYTIPAEILPNHKHKKGALAAARKGDTANPNRESSGSQFYIVQNAQQCAQLDGQYTVFGETVSGLDVVDKIAAVATNAKDCPLQPIKILNILPVKTK